jgi:protein-S-isoprenylcysteine O-methyltransferase Ste14
MIGQETGQGLGQIGVLENMTQALMESTPTSLSERRKRLTDGFLDWMERLVLLAFYTWLVVRLLTSYWANSGIANLLLLPSEGLVVFFILIRRRPTAVSRRWGEWLLAMAASCTPLLAAAEGEPLWLSPAVGATLLMMGMLVQLHAKLTLGRSFGCVPAHRGLKLEGPYRFVRHPMYAGYLLGHLGFLLLNPGPWNLAVYALSYALQIPRLLAEERLLGRDPRYRAYQAGVRYRLIPGLF